MHFARTTNYTSRRLRRPHIAAENADGILMKENDERTISRKREGTRYTKASPVARGTRGWKRGFSYGRRDRESTARPKKRHTTAVFQYFKRTPGYRAYHGQTFNIWSEESTQNAQVFGIFESLYSISSDLFRTFFSI